MAASLRLLVLDLLQRATAHDRRRLLGDDVRARARLLVAALDEQPLRLCSRARALQREAAAQLLTVEHENRVATLERLRPGHPAALLVCAAIPDQNYAVVGRPLDLIVR